MIDIFQISKALGNAKSTPGGVLCRCPCHDDKEASLSLKVTAQGKLAVNCFAGCDWRQIFDELERLSLLPKKDFVKKTQGPQPKEIIYRYVDENGDELFQKVRFANKKGVHRHFEKDLINDDGTRGGYVWNIQGIRNVLYNLPAVLANEVIYLCEGEKDADNLTARGLVGTTNNCGAVSWQDVFTETLRGKVVVICQDNDDAGKKRTQRLIQKLTPVVKELRLFIPKNVPAHGDVTDWIEAGGDVKEIFAQSSVVEKKSDKKQKATREQYFQLFDSVLNNPRKCIFSEKLMTFDEVAQLWNPAVNYLDVIKSEAAVAEETAGLEFKQSLIQPHFFAFENSKRPEFLVELPEWDQRDRISEMAYFVKLKREAGVSESAFSEMLKEWMGVMFQRLFDPMVQNKIMILQGGQGVGKDTWISMLTDGLGQFAVPFTLTHEDKDMYLKLHRGLVMKISEFDRTAKAEVATLKDIITAPSTDIRAPYDRDAKIRRSRCSFISSANIENILRDYTGNRRFMIFEIESIEYAYKGWSEDEKREWRLQCLAEAAYLAKVDYKASAESLGEMGDYIRRKTPEDPADETLREYMRALKTDELKYSGRSEISEHELLDLTHDIKQRTGLNVRAIREQLRRRCGIYRREGEKRVWYYRTEMEH